MVFRFEPDLPSVLRGQADLVRAVASSRSLGLSSITKGEGSLDLLPTDESTTPAAIYGDLPGGGFGVGVVIDGRMENLAEYSYTLKGEVAAERVRNDSQDSTLASHNTRITTAQARADKGVADAATAQSTANGAVSVNSTQNDRLSALEGKPDGATQSEVAALRARVAELERRMEIVWSHLGIIGA